jgi:hypothetical protein
MRTAKRRVSQMHTLLAGITESANTVDMYRRYSSGVCFEVTVSATETPPYVCMRYLNAAFLPDIFERLRFVSVHYAQLIESQTSLLTHVVSQGLARGQTDALLSAKRLSGLACAMNEFGVATSSVVRNLTRRSTGQYDWEHRRQEGQVMPDLSVGHVAQAVTGAHAFMDTLRVLRPIERSSCC